MKMSLSDWIRSLVRIPSHGGRRQQKRRTRGRPPAVEALEQRLLLATATNTYSVTIVEDNAGDGVTADDLPAAGWLLFNSEGSTTYRYSCSGITATRTSSSGFVANGSSVTLSTTSSTFDLTCPVTVTDPDGTTHVENRTTHYENVITTESGGVLVEQPPVGQYWEFTGYDCPPTSPNTSRCTLFDSPAKFAYYHVPSVTGVVFQDHNGDGVRDSDDEPLPGSSVCIEPGAFNADSCLENGFFRFRFRSSAGGLSDDSFAPNQVVAGGDANYTLPAVPRIALGPALSGRPPFSLSVSAALGLTGGDLATTGDTRFNPDTSSAAVLNRDLGLFVRSNVSGLVYLDHNGNGDQDPDDQPFNRRPLNVLPDNNGDGQWTSELDCSFTDPCRIGSVGSVSFSDGTYSVVGPGNFGPNAPSDRYTITEGAAGYTAMSGVNTTDAKFGIFENAQYIFGVVFDDINGNGVQDVHGVPSPEPVLPDVTIELDLNNDGSIDQTAVTGQDGFYRFDNIGPGTHHLNQVLDNGRERTAPALEIGYEFSLLSGQAPPFFGFGNQLRTTAVNSVEDKPDLDPSLERCDIDLRAAGIQCSLRAAIQEANQKPGGQHISFNILPAGPKTIRTTSPLPTITDRVTIDGTTQPGSGRVELVGSSAGAGANGIKITAGLSVVRGLVINGFSGAGIAIETGGGNRIEGNRIGTDSAGAVARANGTGIKISGSANNIVGGSSDATRNVISGNSGVGIDIVGAAATGNVIRNNYVGTNASGTAKLANSGEAGIRINGARNNTVGGSSPAARNVVSGNSGSGILIANATATGNVVSGNYVGTNAGGTAALANEGDGGVEIFGAPSNTVGGATPAARNVVSGNSHTGVRITGAAATGNVIEGNFIGTDADGFAAVRNVEFGVYVEDGSENTIGGMTPDSRNVISGNGKSGIALTLANQNKIQANVIGMDAAQFEPLPNKEDGITLNDSSDNLIGGTDVTDLGPMNFIMFNEKAGINIFNDGLHNTVRLNSITRNKGLGIDLGDLGVNVNDSKAFDADTGSNDLMNYPESIVVSFSGLNMQVTGKLATIGPATVTIDLYGSDAANASGFGEGEEFVGSIKPTATGDFLFVMPAIDFDKKFLAATATDKDGNTSEFSVAIPVCQDTNGNNNRDDDGDGLCDDWETNGIDIDGDGTIDLPLNLAPFNANPQRKDLFVEVDYMKNATSSDKPDPRALADVTRAFAGAPVGNPQGGPPGINLHLMVDEAIATVASLDFDARQPGASDDFDDFKTGAGGACGGGANAHFGTRADRASDNCEAIIAARTQVFRYVLFAHGETAEPGTLGTGEIGGNDLVVTVGDKSARLFRALAGLGNAAPVQEARRVVEAATLMHEFGHNLNLLHGGGDRVNCKPNYLSVMNYTLATLDNDPTRPLDYSHAKLPTLNELNLSEPAGVGGPAGRKIVYGLAGPTLNAAANGPVDWDADGVADDNNVPADVNFVANSGCEASPGESLEGFNDWANIVFTFRNGLHFAADLDRSDVDEPEPEIDPDAILAAAMVMDFDEDGFVNALDNCPGVANADQSLDFDTDGIGDPCETDFDGDGVDDAIEDAAPNSGDLNGDATADRAQRNVASLPNIANDLYVTLVSPVGTTLDGVLATENPSPSDVPGSATFPVGFFGFTIQSVTPGGSATVTLHLPAGTQSNTYLIYGPTAANPTPHWYNFNFDGTTGAEVSGDLVTLHFIDGGRGDADLTANGQIVDPGAPATGDLVAPTVLTLDTTGTTGISTITLTFSEPLAASAAATNNFEVKAAGRDKKIGTADDAIVALTSVTFISPAALRLTLASATAIKLNQFFRVTAFATPVPGGRTGVTDTAGNQLDGNRDTTGGDHYSVFAGRGTKFSYVDKDSDTVSLSLKTGSMILVRDAASGEGETLQLSGTTSRSTLSGSVKKPKRGATPENGKTTLQSITGLGPARNNLPAAQVIIPPGRISAVVVDSLLEFGELTDSF